MGIELDDLLDCQAAVPQRADRPRRQPRTGEVRLTGHLPRNDAQSRARHSEVDSIFERREEIETGLVEQVLAPERATRSFANDHRAVRRHQDRRNVTTGSVDLPPLITELVEQIADLRHRCSGDAEVILGGAQPSHQTERQEVAVGPELLPLRGHGGDDQIRPSPEAQGAARDSRERSGPLSLVVTEVERALVRAPRGLPSTRAVAAATGSSPTTASAVLVQLEREGLVHQREEHRIVRGRSRRMLVWYANLDAPAVQSMLPYLHRVTLPDPPGPSVGSRLPDHLWHLFWNADPTQIDPQRDATLIAHRAMTTADPEAVSWAVSHLPVAAFEEALGYRGTPADAVAWLRACAALERAGDLTVTTFTDVTINGLLDGTKVQILEASTRRLLDPPTVVTAMPVAGVRDLMADKLKVVRDRGELRDYFDLMAIEEDGVHRCEQGLAYYLDRYDLGPDDTSLTQIVRALGYLDDVADDPGLPVSRDVIEDYWRRRQPELVKSLASLSYTHGVNEDREPPRC